MERPSKYVLGFVGELDARLAAIDEDEEATPPENILFYDAEIGILSESETDWDYWGENYAYISFGCLSMTVDLEQQTFRSWHTTADDDPVTALNRGLEYPGPYDIINSTDEGSVSWHACLALPGAEQDKHLTTLFGALALWVGPDLKMNYLPRTEDDRAHYLCDPDPAGLRVLDEFMFTYFRKCVLLGCKGAAESKEFLDMHSTN